MTEKMKKYIIFPLKEIGLKKQLQKTRNFSAITQQKEKSEILFITSYPPREYGIATYCQDLIKTIKNKFEESFDITFAALENKHEQHRYNESIKYNLTIVNQSYNKCT